MIRIFMTGDNHIGKKFDRYGEIREVLSDSRKKSLRDAVRRAEEEQSDLFVITGDLFDSVSGVRTGDVREVAELLAGFPGTVLVLPGNHDYYTGEEKVWRDFEKALDSMENNIILLKEEAPLSLRIREEQVLVYPAICRSKHSEENALGWIKESLQKELSGQVPSSDDCEAGDTPVYKIGLAHGALEGLTPDMKNEYFRMTESELLKIPVDLWLIGHTHIPYPALQEEKALEGFRIFNAGTHEQTDLHNRTEGWCFLLTLDRAQAHTKVAARRIRTGQVHFYDLTLSVKEGQPLEAQLRSFADPLPDRSILRLTLQGTLSPEEYEMRTRTWDTVLRRFLSYEIVDEELSESITGERIRAEFPEIGFASAFLTALLPDPKEAQMAYELVKECREEA